MKAKYLLPLLLAALLLLPVGLIAAVGSEKTGNDPLRAPVGTAPSAPLGTSFTYQGLLTGDGDPVAGPCDFQFGLWDDPISGTLVAGPLERTGVPLTDGRFTVLLDFGDVYDGAALWLAIAAQCPGDPGYGTLDPRQPLTAAPYARAVSWNGVYDMPAGFADGVDDDTLYDAGTGLALAGTTFSITPTYRLPQACGGGQVGKWNGTDWYCADDIFSIVISGTNIFAGEGLYAVTQSNSITLNVFFGGNGTAGSAARSDHDHLGIYAPLVHTHAGEDITAGTVADVRIAASIARDSEITPTVWANDGAGSGLDADLLDGLHGAAYQLQVTGTCAVGSSIRAVNADGTVVCEPHDTRPVFSRTALDASANTTGIHALTIGTDGLGLLSYWDGTNFDLKVAHCSNVNCTAATITTLDSAGDVGYHSSIAIGADGLGLISYYDVTNQDLKVAHCSNVNCTAAVLATLDSIGASGAYVFTALDIGVDGLGLIGYYDATNGNLKVVHLSNRLGTPYVRP